MPSIAGCPPYPGVVVERYPVEVFIPKNAGIVYHTHRDCIHIDARDGLKRYTHCTVCARHPDKPSAENLMRATVTGSAGVCYICGGTSRTPFPFCGSCGKVSSFHHHSCCPANESVYAPGIPPTKCYGCRRPIFPARNRVRCVRCHNFLHLTCIPAHEPSCQGAHLANPDVYGLKSIDGL